MTFTGCLCLAQVNLFAQELDNLTGNMKDRFSKALEKPVLVNGGFSAQFGLYDIQGAPLKRDPFIMALNANINFKFFNEIDMPLAINYSNKKFERTYANPLKEMLAGILATTGISPKYKWVTLHLGERSMNFSPNTYSGLMFYGIGVEVNPPEAFFDVAAFYGRFNKAVLPDTLIKEGYTQPQPSYERWGEGIKIGVGKKSHRFEVIMFHAADKVKSLDSTATQYNLKPQENLIISLHTKNKLTPTISIDLEYVMSAYTADRRAPARQSDEEFSYFNNLGSLFSPLLSTRYNRLFIGGIKYTGSPVGVGATYRRIEPTFVSLGVNSLTTDIEEYTGNVTYTFFKSKINLAGNIGTQHNNLDGTLLQSQQRLIYDLNMTYAITKQLNLSGSYANFNTSSQPSVINLVDTVKLMQVNKNTASVLSYSFGKDFKQNIALSSNFQTAQDIQETPLITQSKNTNVNNQVINYNLLYVPWKISLTTSFTYTLVTVDTIEALNQGPAISLRRDFFDRRLQIVMSSAWLNAFQDHAKTTATTNMKLGITFKQSKHHNIKLEGMIIKKDDLAKAVKTTEFQGKFAYNFSF